MSDFQKDFVGGQDLFQGMTKPSRFKNKTVFNAIFKMVQLSTNYNEVLVI